MLFSFSVIINDHLDINLINFNFSCFLGVGVGALCGAGFYTCYSDEDHSDSAQFAFIHVDVRQTLVFSHNLMDGSYQF